MSSFHICMRVMTLSFKNIFYKIQTTEFTDVTNIKSSYPYTFFWKCQMRIILSIAKILKRLLSFTTHTHTHAHTRPEKKTAVSSQLILYLLSRLSYPHPLFLVWLFFYSLFRLYSLICTFLCILNLGSISHATTPHLLSQLSTTKVLQLI